MTIRCFLMMMVCLSSLGCRAAAISNPHGSTSSRDDPPTARAQTPSSAEGTVVYAYYFHQTFRCSSCQSIEETAARAIQEHFAPQIQTGRVVWMSVNIEEPAGKALCQQFRGRTSDLVLARTKNGVCQESKKLDELWGLRDQPDAFSKYLVDEIVTCLSPAPGR